MYSADTFFTLSVAGQIGLALVSVVMGVILALVVRLFTRRLPLVLRVSVALVAIWLFVWLSPQAYYTYYQLIIDGLPAQIVIKEMPGWRGIARLLLFQDQATLSAHGKAVLGWLVIAAVVFKMPRRSELTRV